VARLRGLVGLDSGPDPSRVRRARTVVASTRLAHTLGAPLGPVLDRVSDGLAADEESDGDRRSALAAPRSTATLLGWLPLAGPLLGAIVGADPVGVILGGGAGTVAAIGGIGLVAVGRAWVARLVRVARVDRPAHADG
jgi:tight adherence protein B